MGEPSRWYVLIILMVILGGSLIAQALSIDTLNQKIDTLLGMVLLNHQYITSIVDNGEALRNDAENQSPENIVCSTDPQVINNTYLILNNLTTTNELLNILINLSSSIDRTASSIQDLMRSQGFYTLPTYSTVVLSSSVGSNKIHIVLFNNNSSYVIRIERIIVATEVTAAVTGFQTSYRIQRITGYNGGSPLSIVKFDTRDPDLVNVVSVSSPTSVVNPVTLLSVTVNPEETGGQHMVDLNFRAGTTKPIILRGGEGISVTQYGTAGTGAVSITIVFTIEFTQ